MHKMTAATDSLGYLAASLVLATFCTRSMVPLRTLAIASNFAFISYAGMAELWPILALHAVLLPININRLCEARRERMQAAAAQKPAAVDLGRVAQSVGG